MSDWEVAQTLGNSPENDDEHTSWEPIGVTGSGLSSQTIWKRRALTYAEKLKEERSQSV